MTGRFPFLPSAAPLADHLPPAPLTSSAGGLSPLAGLASSASPFCESAEFHMVRRDGGKLACALCPPPCPDCHGQGYRITTQDGTKPACITCDGLGWLIRRGEPRHG